MKITPRENLNFEFDDSIPRYWFAGDPYKTRVVDGFQLSFPDGERYFITSVRAFKDQITDVTLLKDVKDFIRQEGQHGMLHASFNKILQAQGMPVESIIKQEKKELEMMTKKFSPKFNLALTAAFEHFTAMLAETFFAKKEVMQNANPKVRALMAWHAVEEMEHRSVAFDVYQKAANGDYATRVFAMTLALIKVFFAIYQLTDALLKADGFTTNQRLKMHLKNVGWLFGTRGIFSSMLGKLALYYKPGFHPSHIPVVHNYDAWLAEYTVSANPLRAAEAMLRQAA